MKKWGNITVYIGKIKRESCIECIAEALPAKEEGEMHERSFDEIAWASLWKNWSVVFSEKKICREIRESISDVG